MTMDEIEVMTEIIKFRHRVFQIWPDLKEGERDFKNKKWTNEKRDKNTR